MFDLSTLFQGDRPVPVILDGDPGHDDAIAWVLERRYLKDEHLGSGVADIEEHRCPECDEPLVFQEGCLICTSCGTSKCG